MIYRSHLPLWPRVHIISIIYDYFHKAIYLILIHSMVKDYWSLKAGKKGNSQTCNQPCITDLNQHNQALKKNCDSCTCYVISHIQKAFFLHFINIENKFHIFYKYNSNNHTTSICPPLSAKLLNVTHYFSLGVELYWSCLYINKVDPCYSLSHILAFLRHFFSFAFSLLISLFSEALIIYQVNWKCYLKFFFLNL